jgi:hypothetical protein
MCPLSGRDASAGRKRAFAAVERHRLPFDGPRAEANGIAFIERPGLLPMPRPSAQKLNRASRRIDEWARSDA